MATFHNSGLSRLPCFAAIGRPNFQERPMRASEVTILLLLVTMFCGCRPVSSPWAGTPYEAPQAVDGAGRSTYAPTPTILPAQVVPALDTASQDAAIERFLFQQDPNSGGSK